MVFAIGAGTIRANPRHNFSKQKYQITTTKSIPINRDNLPVNLPEVGCGYSNGRAGVPRPLLCCWGWGLLLGEDAEFGDGDEVALLDLAG